MAGAVIPIAGVATTVLSLHVGPPNYRKHLQTLAHELSERVVDGQFVVGGDLNAARHVDAVYGGRWFTRYFDDLVARGFHDCHWSLHQREAQSFWGRQAQNQYQCDHIFVNRGLSPTVRVCEVIDNEAVRVLSDHGPLRLQLGVPLE